MQLRPFLAGAMAGLLVLAPNAVAFELENLIVTINRETGFHAQLPFTHYAPLDVHDLHVQIIPPQTGEQQWSSSNGVLHGLQFRLVQSSKSSGFIEFLTEKTIANNHFDLRLLISYQDNSWSQHYKIFPTDIPVSINTQQSLRASQSFGNHSQRSTNSQPRASTPAQIDVDLRPAKPLQQSPSSLPIEASKRPQFPANQKLAEVAFNDGRQASSDLEKTPFVSQDSDQALNKASTANYVVVLFFALSLLFLGFWAGRQRQTLRSANTKRQSLKSAASAAGKGISPPPSFAPTPELNTDTPSPLAVKTPGRPVQSATEVRASTQFAENPHSANLIVFPSASKAPADKTAFETQIDLAKIYVGMSDLATARMILNEVVESGSDSERDQALRILKKL